MNTNKDAKAESRKMTQELPWAVNDSHLASLPFELRARVCKIVNMHDELVALCKSALWHLQQQKDGVVLSVENALKEAIAKAEGKNRE